MPKCKGKTQAGKKCKNSISSSSKYCWRHSTSNKNLKKNLSGG